MKEDWIARPEGGTAGAIRLFDAIATAFGRRAGRAILYLVALYFMIRRAPERRASRAFLARVRRRPAGATDVYRHILCFSRVTLDRLFQLRGGLDRFQVETTGLEAIHETLAERRGLLLFSAHFGSYEIMRALSLQRPDIRFRAVIDLEQAPAMSRLLNSLNPALAQTIIHARQPGPAVVLAIRDALAEGAVVTLLADRLRPGGRHFQLDFLGGRAPFPAAPWEIAAALGAPVGLCFGTYLGDNRYHLDFGILAKRIRREREGGEPLSVWAQRYADRLAACVVQAPDNWFNFYDFWQA